MTDKTQTLHFFFFKGAYNGEKTPSLQFQMFEKRLRVAAASRSRSPSQNALPEHQRETKMANALGENEPFVIFWGRREPRRFSPHAFRVESTPGERRRKRTLVAVFFVARVVCWSGGDRMRYCCCHVFLPWGVWVRRSASRPGWPPGLRVIFYQQLGFTATFLLTTR